VKMLPYLITNSKWQMANGEWFFPKGLCVRGHGAFYRRTQSEPHTRASPEGKTTLLYQRTFFQ